MSSGDLDFSSRTLLQKFTGLSERNLIDVGENNFMRFGENMEWK